MVKPFPLFEQPVTIDLGDGKQLPLRFAVISLQRISQATGRPALGRDNCLINMTQETFPHVLYQALCDPKTGDPAVDAAAQPITLDTILALPSSAIAYCIERLTLAYNQQAPPEKKDPAIPDLKAPLKN